VLFAVPVGVPFVVMILRCCFPLTFLAGRISPVQKFERWLRPFFVFLFEVLRRREVFNILAEEVLKMRRRGCCDLFLLKLVIFLHSLRFSGEVKLFLKINSEFENLLGVKRSFYLLLSFP
jgi:hypothetical protein